MNGYYAYKFICWFMRKNKEDARAEPLMQNKNTATQLTYYWWAKGKHIAIRPNAMESEYGAANYGC